MTIGVNESEDRRLAIVRRLLLALIVFGSLGLVTELLILEHYESAWQWTPLVLLTTGIVAATLVGLRPGRRTVRFFRGLMVVFVLASLVGISLHYGSNVALEREMDADIGGFPLFWYAIHGATPALAPGALLQLGILGLIVVYRHPAMASAARGSGTEA